MSPRPIRRALLSVSDKTGLLDLARGLAALGVGLISTGGTRKALADAGLSVRDVADLTGFPEMLDGRVKTLHPHVHGGILAVRDNPEHVAVLKKHGIGFIDLVVCNLYPFEATVARPGAAHEEIVENIDIGGPTLVRAAGKNYHDVAVVADPGQYEAVLAEMRQNQGALTAETRERLAAAAFARIAAYDAAVAAYFARRAGGDAWPAALDRHWAKRRDLRYGENPHQKAAFYVDPAGRRACVATAEVLHGKELSFNNIVDLDSALNVVREFVQPAAVVVKHNNPCGAAVSASLAEAFRKAYEGDPQSAFGGVLAFNQRGGRGDGPPGDGAESLHRVRHRPRIQRGGAVLVHDAADLEEQRPPPAHRAARRRGPGRGPARRGRRRAGADAGRPGAGRRLQGRANGDEAAADGRGMGRPALRLGGVQARQEQRHRAGQGRHGGRRRGRPDEPGGLGSHGGAQGRRARARGRCWRRTPSSRSATTWTRRPRPA